MENTISFKEMVRQDLIITELECNDCNMALVTIADLLYEKGVVKDSFKEALLLREKEYPTGLPLGEINIAIPHAQHQHVNEQAIALAVLKNPVDFNSMEDRDEMISIKLVVCLAMCKDDTNVKILPELIKYFTNNENVKNILNCKTPVEIIDVIQK